jgi:ribosome-binding protein aMBF1 (putative translation factor)
MKLEPKFVDVGRGKRLVVLAEDEYDRLLDAVDAAEARRVLADPHDRELDWREASKDLVTNRIAEARAARGVSQQQLAARLRVGQSTVSRWEAKNANLTLATLRRIAHALDCEAADLLG